MAVAVCYEKPTRFARYTVSSTGTIPKGTLLALTSPNTVAAASADNDVAGGIAWIEKDTADSTTEISAALNGVWGIPIGTAGGITTEFDAVHGAVAGNELKAYTTLDNEKGYVWGKSLEDVAVSTAAVAVVAKIRVNIQR